MIALFCAGANAGRKEKNMSICRGVAGLRGGNPRGIFIHNDAGSQNANAAFYRKWSQTHPLENGFAHAYVASDGILYAEDDAYASMALRADRRKPELLFDRGLSEYGGFGNL